METKQDSLRRKTQVGLLLSVLVVVFTKVASLLSQVVLGKVLVKADFGLFATANATAALATAIRDGGAGKFLIQQGSQFQSVYRSTFWLAIIVNVAITVILAAVGIAFSAEGGETAIAGELLVWIAASVLIQTPVFLGRSLAAFNLNFKWIATVSSVTVTLRYASMILFAIFGYGPLSFVYPMVLTALVEAGFYLWYFRRNKPKVDNESIAKESVWSVGQKTRWIVLGSLATALINNGDYLVMSQFLVPASVGIYYFGFQLTVGMSAVFTGSIQHVLLPSYSRSQEVIEEAVVRDVGNLFLITGPLCTTAALAVRPIIEYVWDGKWDAAIPVSQYLLIVLSVRLASPVFRAAIESTGRWQTQAFLVWGDAIGTTLTSFLVLASGVADVAVFALWIAIYRFVNSIVQMTVSSFVLGFPLTAVLRTLKPIVVSVGLAATCGVFVTRALPMAESYIVSLVAIASFLIVYVISYRHNPEYNRMINMLMRKFKLR